MPSFRETLHEIKGDLPRNTSSIKSFVNNYLFSAQFRILLNHRLGKFFYESESKWMKRLAKYYRYRMNTKRNCDISYKAILGKGLKFPHPLGIVIGEGVVIKENVIVFQQVTFGSHGKVGEELAYPIIENNVKIFAGAKIIGGVTIGENSIIGASSLINKDVPPNSIAYGVPCKIKYLENK